MIDMTQWMPRFQQALNQTFAERVWFVGLQGSYGRGEAVETSDIDVAVILDELTPKDLHRYHEMLDTLPHRELICGFISGKSEIMHWEPSELFQFYHDTRPVMGSLDELLPLIDDAAIKRAVRIGAGSIYHGCVHNMLHERDTEILRGLYKSAVFVVQAICYMETGKYISRQQDLLQVVSEAEWIIADTAIRLKKGEAVDFDRMSEALMLGAATWLART